MIKFISGRSNLAIGVYGVGCWKLLKKNMDHYVLMLKSKFWELMVWGNMV